MNTRLKTILITAAIAFPLGLFAGPLHHHRNLELAISDLNGAWKHINASQDAHEWDEGGHAQKAKDAIQLAKDEVKQAAEYDNHK